MENVDDMRQWIRQRLSYEKISDNLKEAIPTYIKRVVSSECMEDTLKNIV